MLSREAFGLFCDPDRQRPEQCRRLFVLRRVYGLSQREIAQYYGTPRTFGITVTHQDL